MEDKFRELRRGIHEILSSRMRKIYSDPGEKVIAAVLLPLVEREREVGILFTKRTEDVEHHKGEVSFPGGVFEEGDGSPLDVALRELEEELGVPPGDVEILGHLDDTETSTGFIITPIVGWLRSGHAMEVNDREIDRVFDVSIKELSNPDILERRPWRKHDGGLTHVYYFHVEPAAVWGATARILKSFLDILAERSLLPLCH